MNLERDFSSIEGQRGFISLLQSIDDGRLAHAHLFVCADREANGWAIARFAKKILGVDSLESCIDFAAVRPTGAMEQISVDQIRSLRAQIYLSPMAAKKKVVAIFDADRLHPAAANAFLKTLEEPPEDTVVFLGAAREHSLPPTIVGRCSITRLSAMVPWRDDGELRNWLAAYSAWLGELFGGGEAGGNHTLLRGYGLLAKLEQSLAKLADDAPSKREVQTMLLRFIEDRTGDFFRQNLAAIKFFPMAIAALESKAMALALNVNFMACVEAFFIEIFLATTAVQSTIGCDRERIEKN